MSERKFDVLDGSTKIASGLDLDIVFCLIKGYADQYFNQPLKITIKEVDQNVSKTLDIKEPEYEPYPM